MSERDYGSSPNLGLDSLKKERGSDRLTARSKNGYPGSALNLPGSLPAGALLGREGAVELLSGQGDEE